MDSNSNNSPRKVRLVVGCDGLERSETKELELNRLFNGVFSSEGAKECLAYLRSITVNYVGGPNITPNELMHREGSRYLVGIIEQRIEKGKLK